jgi:hypothetical protein
MLCLDLKSDTEGLNLFQRNVRKTIHHELVFQRTNYIIMNIK